MNWRDLSKEHPQIFDSLWLFSKRGKGGDKKFHGAFIPQVAEYLMLRYTQPDDWVFDPFAGSGTTGDVAKRLGRQCFMSDLVPVREDIHQADAKNILIGMGQEEIPVPTTDVYKMLYGPFKFDLSILHPPYLDIIKFSDDQNDLSNCSSVFEYLNDMWKVAINIDQYIKIKGHVALVLGDIYKDSQVVPLSFLVMQQWRKWLPNYLLKAVYIKDIQGNVKDNTANLWKYRHLKNGTNVFKHEYVFIFRKGHDRKSQGNVLRRERAWKEIESKAT